jgi:hypothetical protein
VIDLIGAGKKGKDIRENLKSAPTDGRKTPLMARSL